MSVENVRAILRDHRDAVGQVESSMDAIIWAADAIRSCLKHGGKLMICGNGGSAADAQHIAAEFTGRFEKDKRLPLAAIALTTDTSALTAIANDYGFDQIFWRQVRALGKQGDVLMGISTSGESDNVCLAMGLAKSFGITTIGLAGARSCRMRDLSDIFIPIESEKTARVQEVHILVAHIICSLVEKRANVLD